MTATLVYEDENMIAAGSDAEIGIKLPAVVADSQRTCEQIASPAKSVSRVRLMSIARLLALTRNQFVRCVFDVNLSCNATALTKIS